MSKKIKTRTPDQTITVWDCGCDCAACDQGHHCRNRDKDCHFGEEVMVMIPRRSKQTSRKRKYREVLSPPLSGEKWQVHSRDLPDICEYKVTITLYNPFDETDVGSPVFIRTTNVFAPDERVAVEAALTKLGISWQGNRGPRGACGTGPNPYLIFDPASIIHVLSWGFNEAGAKACAGMSSAKHCYPVNVTKISPTEK